MFTVWSALSPFLRENFKKTCQQTSWLVLQHLWPYRQPTTSPKKHNYEQPLTDPASFGTNIQSLRSVNHPIHRIPKAARPSFASGLSKLINKAISSNSLFDWHRLVCFPLSGFSSGPQSQRISLTSSIKSRINTYTLNQLAYLSLKPLQDKQPHHQPQPTMIQPKTWKDW